MKIYPILIFFVLIACGESNQLEEIVEIETTVESHIETGNENSFDNFVDKIPEYTFPIKMSCDFSRPEIKNNLTEYIEYFPEDGRLISKLNSTTNYSLIIYDFACDYSCPILYSYNSDGIRIDSLNLTPGQCGEDGFGKRKNWFLISENITIQLIDTTEHYNFNDVNGLQHLDSISVETKKYEFSEKGKFNIISENRIILSNEP